MWRRKLLGTTAVTLISVMSPGFADTTPQIVFSGDAREAVNGRLSVGIDGSGAVAITGGYAFSSEGASIGGQPSSSGTVSVNGVGSSWTSYGDVGLGRAGGTGSLTILNGGSVRVVGGGLFMGLSEDLFDDTATPGQAAVSLGGAGSILELSRQASNPVQYVGSVSHGLLKLDAGTLDVFDGAELSTVSAIVGRPETNARVTISGQGTKWTNDTFLDIGGGSIFGSNSAEVLVQSGAHVTTSSLTLGGYPDTRGLLSLDGAGTKFDVISNDGEDGSIALGAGGRGFIRVTNGASLNVDGDLVIDDTDEPRGNGILGIGGLFRETPQGAGTVNIGGRIQFGVGGGSIVFNHTDTEYQFDADISGSGSIRNDSGVTVYSGDGSDFSGPILLTGGSLFVNGSLGGTVYAGATFGGTGTVANLNVSGASLSPGYRSIGQLTVNGQLNIVSYSAPTVYVVEHTLKQSDVSLSAQNVGLSDRIVTGSSSIDGGILRFVRVDDAGTAPLSSLVPDINPLGATFNVITSLEDRIEGQFSSVIDDYDYLDAVQVLSEDGHTLSVVLERATMGGEELRFSDGVRGKNAKAVASLLDTIDGLNDLKSLMFGMTDGEGAEVFSQLTGEIHANVTSDLVWQGGLQRNVILKQIKSASKIDNADTSIALSTKGESQAALDEPIRAWLQPYTGRTTLEGDGDVVGSTAKSSGVLFGFDRGQEVVNWGLLSGIGSTTTSVSGVNSSADVDSIFIGGYTAFSAGGANLAFGLVHARQEIETTRVVSISAGTETVRASYDGGTTQLFGEGSIRREYGALGIEPYANAAYTYVTTEAFSETGDAFALSSPKSTQEQLTTTMGVRFDHGFGSDGSGGKVTAGLGWQHTFGDGLSASNLSIDGSPVFVATTASDDADAVIVDLGLDLKVGERSSPSINYSGRHSSSRSENMATAKLSVSF